MTKTAKNVPRGKPKSNRLWKTQQLKRHSAVFKDKALKSSWDKKMSEKRDASAVKIYEKQLKDERSQRLQNERKKQEESKKRKEANERKAEVVQVIRNTKKLKKMKRKQLKLVEKR